MRYFGIVYFGFSQSRNNDTGLEFSVRRVEITGDPKAAYWAAPKPLIIGP